jgi:tRNA(adenine34) deaminase
MRLALAEAAHSSMLGEVPVGAIVVLGQDVIGQAGNLRESLGDPTAHAEVLALRRAAKRIGSWRLDKAALYVTQEPCPMCAGALVNARVSRVIYGCANPNAGAVRTLFTIVDDARLNHRVEVVGGVLAAECAGLLRDFFGRMRADAQQGLMTAAQRHSRYSRE